MLCGISYAHIFYQEVRYILRISSTKEFTNIRRLMAKSLVPHFQYVIIEIRDF